MRIAGRKSLYIRIGGNDMIHMPERLQLVENGYNKALDDVEREFLKCDKVHYNLQDILNVLNKVKAGETNGIDNK